MKTKPKLNPPRNAFRGSSPVEDLVALAIVLGFIGLVTPACLRMFEGASALAAQVQPEQTAELKALQDIRH